MEKYTKPEIEFVSFEAESITNEITGGQSGETGNDMQ